MQTTRPSMFHTFFTGRSIVTGLPDSPKGNWVDSYAPRPLQPWLRLIRADRPVGTWLLLWPCWWSVALAAISLGERPRLPLLFLFAAGAFVMRSAGCIYNDILDRDIDAKVERTKNRPLAAGQISLAGAIAFMIALCLAGLAVLLQFNIFTVVLGLASIGIVLIYPLMKRVTFWAQAVLGMAFSWGALMGWASIYAELSLAAILLYFASVSWTIGYDTIYAHQDKEDDAMIGLKSTSLKFGEATKLWLVFFYGFTIAALGCAGLLAGAGLWYFSSIALGAIQLGWQIVTLDIGDADNCLRRFRSNRGFGALIFAGLTIDAAISAIT